MHLSVDPKVARALYYAWRAREQLGLSGGDGRAHGRRPCARSRASPFFRYPNVRLNQINFSAELHACAASMTGDPTLLRRDYRRQLGALPATARSGRCARGGFPNLGPSYNFHRNPFQRAGAKHNIESTEYANIVLDVIYYYEQARREGMTPISERHARTLRAWVRRALPAYWTHSGYVNWDTGLYLYRWHLSRYWAWCCQGLLAIASSKNFVTDNERRWAKFMFDRSLDLYERFTERWDDDRREPGSSLYGVTTKFSEGRHFELARFQALAAEAVLRGMGDDPAEEPPPLYAFDPSIGRLAITTPTYNTAIVPVSNGAFPYGGIDLARWFDSRQRVISHIGGRAPAGFGLGVRAPNGKLVTASQRPRTLASKGRIPLILNKSPQGPITRVKRYPSSPHAGVFSEIESGGLIDRAGVRFRSRYTFRTDRIDVAWQATRARLRRALARGAAPELGGHGDGERRARGPHGRAGARAGTAARRSTSRSSATSSSTAARAATSSSCVRSLRGAVRAARCSRRSRAPTRARGRASRCGWRPRRAGTTCPCGSRWRRPARPRRPPRSSRASSGVPEAHSQRWPHRTTKEGPCWPLFVLKSVVSVSSSGNPFCVPREW